MLALAMRLQNRSSRRLQDVLTKSTIFVLVIRLQDVFKTSSRRVEDVLPRRLQNVFKTSCKVAFKALSRRFQDVSSSKTFLVNIFKMSSRLVQHVFETYCEDNYLQKNLARSHVWNLWSAYKVSKSEIFGYTETFKAGFLQHFMKWLLLQTKILLLKSGIRKDDAVSVNKESMNRSGSKKVFLRF